MDDGGFRLLDICYNVRAERKFFVCFFHGEELTDDFGQKHGLLVFFEFAHSIRDVLKKKGVENEAKGQFERRSK